MAIPLATAFNAHDSAAYGKLLAPNLMVYSGPRTLARSRAEWMSLMAPALAPDSGARVHLAAVARDDENGLFVTDEIATEDRFHDCCHWGRIVHYKVADGVITEIRFITGYDERNPLLLGGFDDSWSGKRKTTP